MLMEMFILGNERMIKQMEKEFILKISIYNNKLCLLELCSYGWCEV